MFSANNPQWKTKIDTTSAEFTENYKGMEKLVQQLNERLALSRSHGEEKYIKKHVSKGGLLARERIELLLDEDSPFIELMPFAGYGMKNQTMGGSLVAGIGLVCGVECLISSNVSTIKGGAVNKAALKKTLRLNEIAMQNRLPSISLLQSAGADLTQQDKVFHMGMLLCHTYLLYI